MFWPILFVCSSCVPVTALWRPAVGRLATLRQVCRQMYGRSLGYPAVGRVGDVP